jgi:hypothetical protein
LDEVSPNRFADGPDLLCAELDYILRNGYVSILAETGPGAKNGLSGNYTAALPIRRLVSTNATLDPRPKCRWKEVNGGQRRVLSGKFLNSFCDLDSGILSIDEHSNVDRKPTGRLRCEVIPEMLPGPDRNAHSLGKFVVDLRANRN